LCWTVKANKVSNSTANKSFWLFDEQSTDYLSACETGRREEPAYSSTIAENQSLIATLDWSLLVPATIKLSVNRW
jgi:hypothetical protein